MVLKSFRSQPCSSAPFSVFVFGFLFSIGTVFGQINNLVNPANLGDWRPGITVGVPGGIPNDRTNIIDVTLPPYNADKTGVQDVASIIQSALNAAPSNAVVYLPAGKYRLTQGIYFKPHVTLRGAGMTNTILICSGAGISVERYTQGYWTAGGYLATGGLGKGSTTLTMSDTSEFKVGYVVQIARFNSTNQYDNPLVHGSGGSTNGGYGWLYKNMHRVTAKTANSISIWPPLQGDLSGYPVRVVPSVTAVAGLSPLRRMGVEHLTIDMRNGTGQTGIYWGEAEESWIKGVRILSPTNRGIHFLSCFQMEIRDCYIDLDRGAVSNGSGVLMDATSFCLIENNIIIRTFPCFQNNAGVGNVFAYNFLLNTNGLTEIISNHGAHSAYNLWEGNISGRFMSDGYHGSSSHDTVYRNWLHGTTAGTSSIGWALSLKRFTRSYNLVGNIFGRPAPFTMTYDGTSFGQPNMGNSSYSGFAPPWAQWGQEGLGPGDWQELDTNVLATTTRKGNYDFFNQAIPANQSLGTNSLPPSLYLSAKPAWFGSLSWPPFNPLSPGSLSYTNIPAGYRYVHGVDPPGTGGVVDSQPPSAPANVVATPSGVQTIALMWSPATDNVGVTGYRLERSVGSGSTVFTLIASPTTTNFTDTGLVAGSVYNYRVRATDAAGNVSAFSAVASATATGEPVANQPPTVALSSPASGSSVYAPQVVVLSASAADSDGSVTRVEFYEGINKIGEDTTSPYAVNWNASVPGDYLLTAVAHDNAGAVTLSATTQFKVVQPGISSAQRLANGGFQISANGAVGRTNAIHVSSDLVTWTLLTNVVNTSGTFSVVDPEAAIVGRRFYRVWAESLFLSNVVGFAKVTVPPGYSIVINQFIPATNTVPAVLKGVPGGTTLSKFRSVTGDFSINSFDPVFLEWLDPNQTFGNGETGFLLNPTTNTFTLTFEGQVPQGMLGTALPSGYSMVGSLLPQGGFIQSQLGFPGASGDTVFLYRNGRYRTSQYDPLLGGWDYEPNVNVGEGFFLFKMGATNWLRSFSAFN